MILNFSAIKLYHKIQCNSYTIFVFFVQRHVSAGIGHKKELSAVNDGTGTGLRVKLIPDV